MSLPGSASSESKDALQQIVDRIKAVVEEEKQLLATVSFNGLDRLIARKDQLAIELSRCAKRIDTRLVDGETRALLDEAAKALGSNADLLRRHIEAVSEVASLICSVLVNASSDGTYTSSIASRGTRV